MTKESIPNTGKTTTKNKCHFSSLKFTNLPQQKQSVKTLTFNNQAIEIQNSDGQVWFCAADVTRAIGYKNAAQAIADNVSPKYIRQICLGKSGRKPLFISEPGLYELIMRSNLPAAATFQTWVYEEVLPSIRQTGQYVGQMPLAELGALMANLPTLIAKENASSTIRKFKIRDTVTVDYGAGDRRQATVLDFLGNYVYVKFPNDNVDIVAVRAVLKR